MKTAPLLLVAAITLASACNPPSDSAPTTSAPRPTTSAPTTTEPTTTSEPPTTQPAELPDDVNPLPPDPDGTAQTLTVRVESVLTHDDAAVTTGLAFAEDNLLESTGLYGRSSRRLLDPDTGDVVNSSSLQPELYGQGVTAVDDAGWQVSWQEGLVVVFDLESLQDRRRFTFSGEGWGICELDGTFYTSAADDEIILRDIEDFAPTATLEVTLGGQPVTNLGELECSQGELWAVVWPTAQVVAIDPVSGEITKVVDGSRLVPAGVGAEDVLGAIAYRESTDTWFLTGRRWDVLYEVSFIPA